MSLRRSPSDCGNLTRSGSLRLLRRKVLAMTTEWGLHPLNRYDELSVASRRTYLNYERREMTRKQRLPGSNLRCESSIKDSPGKGSHLSFALSRILACFVVQSTCCGQRPHQTHFHSVKSVKSVSKELLSRHFPGRAPGYPRGSPTDPDERN